MVELTPKSYLTSGATTEANFQAGLGAMYDFVQQLVVGAVPQTAEIVDGLMTPDASCLIITDTENDSAADDLDNIDPDNIGEKTIYLKITSSSRPVTLRHMQSGSGQIMLADGANLVMDHANMLIALRYSEASDRWEELWRNFGIFTPTTLSKSVARAALGLGTAALVDTGTGSSNVPLVSDLGALAFLGAITDSSMMSNGIVTNAKLAGGITIDKLATTTPNSVVTFNSSGNPALLTPTVSNTFLKYNGSGLEFYTPDDTGLTTVGQAELRTAIGSVSVSNTYSNVILPGGQYGFAVQTSVQTARYLDAVIAKRSTGGYVTRIAMGAYTTGTEGSGGGSLSGTAYAQQRYVSASPPYFIEGEVAGFIFLLMENGKVVQTYISETPTWVYNGPTKAAADLVDAETGLKYVKKQRNLIEQIRRDVNCDICTLGFRDKLEKQLSTDRYLARELLSARSALGKETFGRIRGSIEKKVRVEKKNEILKADYKLITPELQNADMNIVPHPFEVKPGQTVVLVGLYSDVVRKLLVAQEEGENITDAIYNGYFYPDNQVKRGTSPNGVQLVDLKVK